MSPSVGGNIFNPGFLEHLPHDTGVVDIRVILVRNSKDVPIYRSKKIILKPIFQHGEGVQGVVELTQDKKKYLTPRLANLETGKES